MRNPQSTTSSQGQRYVISVEHRLAIPSSVCGEGFERKESRALSFRPRESRVRASEFVEVGRSVRRITAFQRCSLQDCDGEHLRPVQQDEVSENTRRPLPRSRERKRQRAFRPAKGA